MSKKTPEDDPRQKSDQGSHKQTDKPWKGNPEKEQRNDDAKIDLEEWQKPRSAGSCWTAFIPVRPPPGKPRHNDPRGLLGFYYCFSAGATAGGGDESSSAGIAPLSSEAPTPWPFRPVCSPLASSASLEPSALLQPLASLPGEHLEQRRGYQPRLVRTLKQLLRHYLL
jgi:hypothetical protein